jgi:hypothetical protein
MSLSQPRNYVVNDAVMEDDTRPPDVREGPSSLTLLLEMVLSYLAAADGKGDGPWVNGASTDKGGTTTSGMDLLAFVISPCKALRRGCHGAPACDWGPAILPIMASLPSYAPVAGRRGGKMPDPVRGMDGKRIEGGDRE